MWHASLWPAYCGALKAVGAESHRAVTGWHSVTDSGSRGVAESQRIAQARQGALTRRNQPSRESNKAAASDGTAQTLQRNCC